MADAHVTLPVVSVTGARVGEVELTASVFAGPVRQHLLYEAVRRHQAAQRSGTASTKTRAFVSGGGKKPWRQKGTGRARAGSSRSPLWAGGAVVFGPQPRKYGYELPKSARRSALRSALAARHAAGTIVVVDALTVPEPKTKRMVELLHALGVPPKGVLVVLGAQNDAVSRAGRNLPKVTVVGVDRVNVVDVLGHSHLVIAKDALAQLDGRLGRSGARGGT